MKIIKISLPILALVGAFLIIDQVGDSNIQEGNELKNGSPDAYQFAELKKQDRINGKVKADAPEMHSIIQRLKRTKAGDASPKYTANQVFNEFVKARDLASRARTSSEDLNFIERGPGNVAGRTRALLVDSDDASFNTWIIGSASGGIWKTSDAGENWEFVSQDIPNLGTNTLAMSASNSQVIYAGTGEHFTSDIDGAGMFKSTDKGSSWVQIADPNILPDFQNVSRIIVDPNNADVVVATTRNSVWEKDGLDAAIYKTVDGGTTWTRVRSSSSERYDDINYDPNDFSTMYVAVQGKGVLKSTDSGDTWVNSSDGLIVSGRIEIDISPANSNRIWASVVGSSSGVDSDLFVSNDAGDSWTLAINVSGSNEDFLGGQGFYDNIITCHPFDENIVYVGGVNTWKFTLGETALVPIESLAFDENGTDEFMTYVNFSAEYFGGILDLGSVAFEDLSSVEVRFGQGTSKAHRFTVGGQGSGVSASSYVYEDYVDVPFQVWDVDNDIQLMVSFRDQQEDSMWNLIESNTSGDTQSREYFFIHNIAYSETPNANISINGGQEFSQMYFFWPVLAAGADFDPSNLPNSSLAIKRVTTNTISRTTASISDAYGEFGGRNSFPQSSRESGIHPDQHNILIYDVDETEKTFRLLIGNDGGVYKSVSSTDPGDDGDFEYVSYGLNTTQFYGADRSPTENRYVGGMQDNGTWYHAEGVEGSASSESTFGIGGDGFEVLWHSEDPQKIIGGSQYNNFGKTTNGGTRWVTATEGLDDGGPFVSRLANSKLRPDYLYTVAASGVWKSTNFGDSWSASVLNDNASWSFNNNADIEVSIANPDVIWAGGNLSSSQRLFISTDAGATFNPVDNYSVDEMGFVSGIGTHPYDSETAYALFSFAGEPKILKTVDSGSSWTDISGFDGTGDRGFPDVAVNCIFVFPSDTDKIWVGTEIGIVESLDGGVSWNLLNSNLPPVNIYDFKLTGDQLVIATYGRGIWSVDLTEVLVSPTITDAYLGIDGELKLGINYVDLYDSVELYLDGELIKTEYPTGIEEVIGSVAISSVEGFSQLSLISYSGQSTVNSFEKEVFLFELTEPKNSYGSNFNQVNSDFIGYGFEIRARSGFDDMALHSIHPYGDATEYFHYLKSPIVVSNVNSTLQYNDIAIIEPGENGSVYLDDDFYDYVVVEGSSDGLTWKPLQPGYDARLHASWLSVYDSEANGSESLFKNTSIDLLDSFADGETIMIRFRLFADPNTNGYGWVIDDLYIQKEKPLGNVSESMFSLYPNPVVDKITIESDLLKDSRSNVRIIGLNGSIFRDISSSELSGKSIDVSNLESGVYFVKVSTSSGSVTRKIIIQ